MWPGNEAAYDVQVAAVEKTTTTTTNIWLTELQTGWCKHPGSGLHFIIHISMNVF